jgi:hypothetical protein
MGNGRANAFNSLMNLCLPSLNIIWPIPAGQTIKYQAATSITTTGLINNTSVAEEKANGFVQMDPGFEATYGSVYTAYIGACSSCITDGATKMLEANNTEENTPAKDIVRNNINLYPNPAGTMLNVEFNLPENASGTLSVTDLTGKIIYKTNLQPGTTMSRVDVSNYENGIYFVNLFSQNNLSGTKKLVVQH